MIPSRWVFAVWGAVLAGGAMTPVAWAHRLDADYVPVPEGFQIEFFFGDGSSAEGLAVTAEPETGEPIVVGTTDAKGVVRFAPPAPGAWTIIGKAAGHANSRNPLVIPADAVAEFLGSKTTSGPAAGGQEPAAPQASAPASAGQKTMRGRFPWFEVSVSLGFIALLTLATLLMMRRSARWTARPAEIDQLEHEIAHLRATVRQLQDELADLRACSESRT